jgi:hypothetical protein
MHKQPAFRIGNARFSGGDATAGVEYAALSADHATCLAHAAHEGELEFQLGVAGANWAA